jgi:hypothetical protein
MSEDCILIDDAKDIMDAVDEQEALVEWIVPFSFWSSDGQGSPYCGLAQKIDTIKNNLQSVLDKDKE